MDLDDTLLDYSGGVDRHWEAAVAAWAPPDLDVGGFVRVLAETRRWFWDDPERHRRERVHMLGAWTHIVEFACERLGRAPDGLAPAIAGEFAARRREAMSLFPDALPRFFDAIVIEGEFGTGKPDELVYRHALAALGAAPAEAWMAGDHLEFDVDAPQRLGLRGVWIDRSGQGLPKESKIRPYRIVRSFGELTAARD